MPKYFKHTMIDLAKGLARPGEGRAAPLVETPADEDTPEQTAMRADERARLQNRFEPGTAVAEDQERARFFDERSVRRQRARRS